MLKQKSKIIRSFNQSLDLGLTALGFLAAYFIKKDLLPVEFRGLATESNYYTVLLLVMIIWLVVFQWTDVYSSMRRISLIKVIEKVFKSICLCFIFLTLLLYVFHIDSISRLMLLIFLIINVITICATKAFVYYTLQRIRKSGYNYKSILVVGRKERALDLLKSIKKNEGAGYVVVGCLDTDENAIGTEVVTDIKVIDIIDNLEQVLKTNVIDELVFAMPLKLIKDADRYILLAEEMGVNVRFMPDWQLHYLMYKPDIATIHFENFLQIPTMALHMTSPRLGSLLFKSIFDYSVAILGSICISPLLIFIAGAIKLFSKGPILYTQKRYGINGRVFNVYKFRTMVQNADQMLDSLQNLNESDGPAFKISNDPRIIPYVGTFLRKTSLDELPQLFNIIKGEMSLVGPRPPIIEEVDEYELWQRRRLSMKPGLTCVWQVTPNRNDVSFEDWMKMDLQYIDKWSLFLDSKILLKTAKVVLFGSGR